MKCRLLYTLSLLLVGCASTITPIYREINTPIPGTVQEKRIGEVMVERGTMRTLPGFVVRKDFYPPVMEKLVFPLFKKGMVWTCHKRLDDDFICAEPAEVLKQIVTDTGEAPKNEIPLFVITNDGVFRSLYYPSNGRVFEQDTQEKGIFFPIDVPLKGAHKTELVYGGKTGDTIRITVREFENDMDHPISVKTREYDLSSLLIISQEDIAIQILDASDTSINYLLIK